MIGAVETGWCKRMGHRVAVKAVVDHSPIEIKEH